MFAGVKWAAQHGVGVVESLFYRQIGTGAVRDGFVLLGPGIASLRSRRVGAHVARMAIGVVAMGLNFAAFTLLPLAEATAIGFSVAGLRDAARGGRAAASRPANGGGAR